MTTTISLDSRAVFSIASDMEDIHRYLRITQDMVMDLLCDYTTNDADAQTKMYERVFLLVEQMPVKLDEMNALNCQLLEESRKMLTA
jgi:hypothetical protein